MPRSLGLDLAKPFVETFSADWQLAQVFLIENIVWLRGENA